MESSSVFRDMCLKERNPIFRRLEFEISRTTLSTSGKLEFGFSLDTTTRGCVVNAPSVLTRDLMIDSEWRLKSKTNPEADPSFISSCEEGTEKPRTFRPGERVLLLYCTQEPNLLAESMQMEQYMFFFLDDTLQRAWKWETESDPEIFGVLNLFCT